MVLGLAAVFAATTVMAESPESPQTEEIKSEYFTPEYTEITYSGEEQKPTILARIGDNELVEDTDFTVEYPEDCITAGDKTIIISGMGAYSGETELSYMIEPLDVTKDENISVSVPPCVYNGSAQCPAAVVMFGEETLIEGEDFTSVYSNNIYATVPDKAKCVLTFMGNYTGTRTVLFDIDKAPSENREITLKANRSANTVFALSALKPAGASFGTPIYDPDDFDPANKPKIAFNELRFALNAEIQGSAIIRVPVKNLRNYADYELVFTVEAAENGVPNLVIRKISKEYDGEPITAEELTKNGSYAEFDGQRIEGEWSFIDEPPVLPCDTAVSVMFTPTDSALESAVGVAGVSISKLRAAEFSVSASSSRVGTGESVSVKVSGIPDDYSGGIRVKCSGEGAKGFILTQITDTEYTAQFPENDALYTFTAELSGDEIYAARTAEFTVRVGNAELPEEQIPAKITAEEELAQMVNSAEEGAEIAAEGCKSIPAEIVKAAAEKELTLRVKLNDSYTWVIETDKLSRCDALNLALTPAVIPYVLLERIGGDTSASFNVLDSNLGSGALLEVTTAQYDDDIPRFANLFLYNTDGELEFVSCNRVNEKGKAVLAISKRGKYAVITDSETKMRGDLNNDMRINATDATEVLKITVGLSTTDSLKGDTDGDGKITARDATQILKYLVGLPSALD